MSEDSIQNFVRVGGNKFNCVLYGEEQDDWGAERQTSHDCGVRKGELHIFGCDVERCPVCGGQRLPPAAATPPDASTPTI